MLLLVDVVVKGVGLRERRIGVDSRDEYRRSREKYDERRRRRE